MTGDARASVAPIVQLSEITTGDVLSEHQGQSRRVCTLVSHPGWVYKEYKSALPAAASAHLDRLIALPARFTATEREVVAAATSWPGARVVRGDESCGVLMPLAPDGFSADLRLPGGRVERRTRNVDWLAQTEAAQRARGIDPPSLAERVAVCASLVAVAALFERHRVVYLDWSFANAFWSDRTHQAYVIDIDGCSFGPRPMIECPGWADPLFPMGAVGGHPVDRYRVALLVARCLTVRRDSVDAAIAGMSELAAAHPALGRVHILVERALTASQALDRPPLAALAQALREAGAALAGPVRPVTTSGGRTAAQPRPFTVTGTPLPSGSPEPGAHVGGNAAAVIALAVVLLIVLVAFVIL